MIAGGVPQRPPLSRRTRILIGGGLGLLVVLIAGSWLIDVAVNWLWFGAVGYSDVYRTVLLTRLVQFVVGGVLIGGVLALNLVIAYRARPSFVTANRPEDPLAGARAGIMRRIRLVGVGVPVGVGLVAGLIAQGDWRTVLLFLHGTSFGIEDPEFGRDIAFYVFDLPFYEKLVAWAFGAVVVALVGAVLTHYLFGGLRLTGLGGLLTGAATAQLGILGGILGLLLGVEYFFERYELLFSQRSELFTGATYTDLNAMLPAKVILAVIAVICALVFFGGAFLRNLALPAIATVLLIVSAILLGGVWPLLLQQFSVNPNANNREALSIGRNIDATRQAYGITDKQVSYVDYFGDGTSNAAQLANESATVSNIRLLDPSLLEQTFTQLQQRENYYGFPDQLDVDRYEVDGELQDYVVALRELETGSLAENQRSWINQHLRYTHGDGFVAARADRVNAAPGEAGSRGGDGYVDGDPYPAVVDGRIRWIVDGYTTLENYPYAQRTTLGATTQDTTPGTAWRSVEEISYIRHAVKATVDAYDGTVTLYAFDESDPVLATWMKVFPGVVAPASEISDELRRHFRYPQDLFTVQRQLLTRYHVEDPQVFFSTNDFWDVPTDPTDDQTQADQPPYYVLAGPPAADGPATFQLTSALVGLRRQFLSAYASVSSAPDSYGAITVLRFPTDSQALGPQQVQTRFRSSADQDASFPQLSRVLVLYGDRVGYAPTLNEALQEAAGAATTAPSGNGAPTAAPGAQQASPQIQQAVAAMAAALQQLQDAKAAGNFAAEGRALAELDAATTRFQELTAES